MSDRLIAAIDDNTIRAIVKRLARPSADGGYVIERAAILAAGPDATAIEGWILSHAGEAELLPSASVAGLHGNREDAMRGSDRSPRRFLLPSDALKSAPEDLPNRP